MTWEVDEIQSSPRAHDPCSYHNHIQAHFFSLQSFNGHFRQFSTEESTTPMRTCQDKMFHITWKSMIWRTEWRKASFEFSLTRDRAGCPSIRRYWPQTLFSPWPKRKYKASKLAWREWCYIISRFPSEGKGLVLPRGVLINRSLDQKQEAILFNLGSVDCRSNVFWHSLSLLHFHFLSWFVKNNNCLLLQHLSEMGNTVGVVSTEQRTVKK